MKTVNHECYVSFEVAKLLRQLGFDWECCYCYDAETKDFLDDNEGMFNFNEGDDNDFYSAPTLDVAQRWLRKEKNLILLIDITPAYYNGKPMCYRFVIHISCGNHIYGEWKDTYEDAQESGIKKALELILEKGE